jgi:hypothetical protein
MAGFEPATSCSQSSEHYSKMLKTAWIQHFFLSQVLKLASRVTNLVTSCVTNSMFNDHDLIRTKIFLATTNKIIALEYYFSKYKYNVELVR